MSRMSRSNQELITGTCTGFATTPLSISIWVRVYNIISDIVCGVGTVGSTNNQYNLALGSTNRAQANEMDTVASGAQTVGAISSGVWHNLTGVFAAHNDRRIYVDGGSKATNATARTCGATTGAFALCNAVGSMAPSGDYCHFAVWNIALSDADAANLFARGPACTQAANLVEYWPFYGNLSPEPSTQTANALTVTASQYSPMDPFANFSRLPYSTPVFLAA